MVEEAFGRDDEYFGFQCQQCGDDHYLNRPMYDLPENNNYYRIRESLHSPRYLDGIHFNENEIVCHDCDEKDILLQSMITIPGIRSAYMNFRNNSIVENERNEILRKYAKTIAKTIQSRYRGLRGRRFANRTRRAHRTLHNNLGPLILHTLYKPNGILQKKISKKPNVVAFKKKRHATKIQKLFRGNRTRNKTKKKKKSNKKY
jgi:hypothetical protein